MVRKRRQGLHSGNSTQTTDETRRHRPDWLDNNSKTEIRYSPKQSKTRQRAKLISESISNETGNIVYSINSTAFVLQYDVACRGGGGGEREGGEDGRDFGRKKAVVN